MRKDMHKVLTERPRYGSSNKSKKTALRIYGKDYDPCSEYDDSPSRVSSNRYKQYVNHKNFNDLIGPLRRFLRANIDRPWDKVYSDICRSIDRRSTVGNHLFQHLFFEIEFKCEVDEKGIVCLNYGIFRKVRGFYVHPETRFLSYA